MFLEVDEDQHKAPGYHNDKSGDMKRMVKVMNGCWLDEKFPPVVWLRYNPDPSNFFVYQFPDDTPETKPQFKSKEQREELLIKHLKSIDLDKKERVKIEYAFYDARVVGGKTIAETTTKKSYDQTLKSFSTVPEIFAYNPTLVPTEINDVDMVSGDDDDASYDSDDYEEEGTSISSMDLESQESDTERLYQGACNSQGTDDPATDILGQFDSADF